MSMHAAARVRTTEMPAAVPNQRQRTVAHAIVHLLALSGLTVLVLVGAAVVLWTEPYPSVFIGVASAQRRNRGRG